MSGLTHQGARVIQLLREQGPMTAAGIAHATGMSGSMARATMAAIPSAYIGRQRRKGQTLLYTATEGEVQEPETVDRRLSHREHRAIRAHEWLRQAGPTDQRLIPEEHREGVWTLMDRGILVVVGGRVCVRARVVSDE